MIRPHIEEINMVSKSTDAKAVSAAMSLFPSSFVADFSWTVGRMFLESFLASKTKLTSEERSTVQDALSILKKYLDKKK
jgi:hypothetical protein